MRWRPAAASVREAIAPRVNTRGETVGLVDGRPVSVWPFIEGQWAADDDEQQWSQAPVLLAAIHRALEGATVGPRPVRSAPSTFVPEVEDPELDKWLGDFLKSHPHHQPLHGDFYAGNLLVRDRQVVAVLDWDEAFVGPRRWSSHGPHGSWAMACGRTTSATSWSSRTVTALQVDEPAL
jgi:Ser/Thr protein kinase RdoA (MazF antagonist)